MTQNHSTFSINCVDWLLLQDPSEDSLTKSDVIRGRFIGDPSYEVNCNFICPNFGLFPVKNWWINFFQYEHVDVQRVGEGEDAHDEETVFTIKVIST